MKIHAQPAMPLIPSILMIAAASRPEKAPDKEAAEKNSAILGDNRVKIIDSLWEL